MEDRVKDYSHQYRRGRKSFAQAIKEQQLQIRGAAGGGLQQLPKLPKAPEPLRSHIDDVVMVGYDSEDGDNLAQVCQSTVKRSEFYVYPGTRSLATYSDAEMIMEMIGRGYAVMKTPQGGTPETLK